MINFVPPSKGIYKNKEDGKLGFRSIIGSPPSYIIPIYYDEQNNAHFLNFGEPNYDEKYLLCNDLVTMYLDVTEDGPASLIFTNSSDRDLCDWAVDGQVCYVSDIVKYYKWVDSSSEWEEVLVEEVVSHVQSDWEEKDKDEPSYIRNKPITTPTMQLPIADSVENKDTIKILHNAKKFGYLYSGWTFLDLIDNGGTPELQYNSRLINGDYSSFRVPTDDEWKSLEEELGMPEGERNFEKTEIDRGHNTKVGVKMSGFMNLFTEEYKGYFMDGDEVDADFGLSRFDIVPSGFLEYSSSLGNYTFSYGRELTRGVWWSQTHEIKQGVYRSMIRRVFPKDVNKPEHIDFAKGVARVYGRVNTGLSIRLVRDTTGGESSLDNFTIIKKAYVDNVDNEYDGVKIGNYVWLTQNLLDTKYNDGSDINYVDNNDNNWEDWNDSYIAQEGAYCAYMFDENNAKNEVADEYKADVGMIREGIEMYISCTYDEFMELKSNSKLVGNLLYVITDYQAIYDQPDFEDIGGSIVPKMTIATKTAAVERLVVLATSSSTIAPQAWSVDYPKDYIEYDPDLATTYVNEAATKGKITFRRDENGNEANCDLKGVLLKRYDRNGDGEFVHIADSGSDDFDDGVAIFGDMCFHNTCCNNSENLYLIFESPFDVANIQLGEGCFNNQFGFGCQNNQLGGGCSNNQFEVGCQNNQLGEGCYNNQFSEYCQNNQLGEGCYNNQFSEYCQNNQLGEGCFNNQFGFICLNNQLGEGCYNNQFELGCYNNQLGGGCSNNQFSEYCQNNQLGEGCYNNQFSEYCQNIEFGKYNYKNKFEYGCYDITLGESNYKNKFEYGCYDITLGESNNNNTFEYGCQNIELGESNNKNSFEVNCQNIQLGENCSNNTFESNCQNVIIGNDAYSNNFKRLENVVFGNLTRNNFFETELIGTEQNPIDLTSATHIYQWYPCWIFKNASGDIKLRYYDGDNVLQIVDITD